MSEHSRSSELLRQFQSVEQQLAALLAEDRSHEVAQELLDCIRELYLVRGPHGNAVPVPCVIHISLQTMRMTDIAPTGRFAEIVRTVSIRDVLSAHCLKGLEEHYGEVGVAARKAVLEVLLRNVRARVAATRYRPRTHEHEGRRYLAHNDLVAPRRVWDASALRDVAQKLERHSVFRQHVHDENYGTPFTSVTDNPDMRRQWTTDSMMAGLIQKQRRPHLWPRNLITNAGFLCTPDNVAAMLRTLRDPRWYREGDAQNGIAHIFLPMPKQFEDEGLRWDEERKIPVLSSIKEDPAWFNRKRLESQALLLQELVAAIKAGAFFGDHNPRLAALGAEWGFHWCDGRPDFPKDNILLNEHQKRYVLDAIQVSAIYLLAVQWNGECYDFAAPSVSSWEEAPFAGGCASDTGFMVDAIDELRDLLNNPAYHGNATIEEVRSSLQEIRVSHEQEGEAAALLPQCSFADFRIAQHLVDYIDAGKRKLAAMVIQPVLRAIDGDAWPTPAGVAQFYQRPADSSLALLAAYYKEFDRNPARDAQIRLGIMLFLEAQLADVKLEERLGLKRYRMFEAIEGSIWALDSYLNYQFDLGLLLPGMVAPMFADRIGGEHRRIVEYVGERRALGTASPRDDIVDAAYRRYVSETSQDLSVEPKRDATSAQAMIERQQFSLPEWVARWTLGSTAGVIALARAKLAMLQRLELYGRDERMELILEEIDRMLTRFINLSLLTIVQNVDAEGETVYRADGTELPDEYCVMEAFQVVPDVEGNIAWLPGCHTLPWSASQLFEGLRLARTAAARQESMR